jgi:xanthine dehydrogenase YagS FAD-binding subunit
MRGQRPSRELFQAVAEEALRGAAPRRGNEFKVPLGKRAVVRALTLASSAGAA